MGSVYLLYSKDITTQAMNNAILACIKKSSSMVYIITSYSLKLLRVDMNANTLTEKNTMMIGEFERKVKRQVYKRKDYITRADQQYLLNKVIEKNYNGTEQYEVFKSIRYDLFNLFDFLQFNDIRPLDEKILDAIRRDYSGFEYDIFWLYGQFSSLINAITQAAERGIEQPQLSEYGINPIKQKKLFVKVVILLKQKMDVISGKRQIGESKYQTEYIFIHYLSKKTTQG